MDRTVLCEMPSFKILHNFIPDFTCHDAVCSLIFSHKNSSEAFKEQLHLYWE